MHLKDEVRCCTNTHTATISPSTYTGSELATALVTAMNYATLLTSPNYTNTVSFDSKALKFTITSTVSIGDGFTLTYGGASDILPSLGFTETQARDAYRSIVKWRRRSPNDCSSRTARGRRFPLSLQHYSKASVPATA